jgi:hypothetical protein
MLVFDPELAARMKMPKELLEKAQDLHFTLHIGRQHIHAALYNFAESDCLWHVHSEVPPGLSIYKFIYQRNWIEGVFRRCTITFDSDSYALVPVSFFDSNTTADYLQLQHGVSAESAGYTEIPEAESVMCFEIPDWQADVMRHFPNARILPVSSLLLRLVAARPNLSARGFLVMFSSYTVSIAAMRDREIVLLSTHEARTAEDALYHLSNAAMRLQIDPENCQIEYLDTAEQHEFTELLKKYFGAVKPLIVNAEVNAPVVTQIHYLCA